MTYVEYGPDAERWTQRLTPWVRRLHAVRLDGLVAALLDAAEPFGPLGAQALWVAQPTLSLLMPREDVAALARLLDAPGGVAWLRDRLDAQLADLDDGAES